MSFCVFCGLCLLRKHKQQEKEMTNLNSLHIRGFENYESSPARFPRTFRIIQHFFVFAFSGVSFFANSNDIVVDITLRSRHINSISFIFTSLAHIATLGKECRFPGYVVGGNTFARLRSASNAAICAASVGSSFSFRAANLLNVNRIFFTSFEFFLCMHCH